MRKRRDILILAIETSADETSAAVLKGRATKVKSFRLLSNIVFSQTALHTQTGGIVPEVAARAHIPKILPVIKLALQKAQTSLSALDAIAVTAGPGLITSLMVGVDTAKTLAFALNKPVIPVNHLEGHLLSAFGGNFQFPIYNLQTKLFPAVGLVVSGGHTLLVLVQDFGRYKILGQTLDDAAGEAFDKTAKIMGLPYPGGPQIAKLAKRGNPKAFELPRPMLNQKNYNFSFAGLKTAARYLYHDVIREGHRPGRISRDSMHYRPSASSVQNDKVRADIAASIEQAIVDVLVTKTIRAAKEYKAKTVLLGGGVAANEKLRKTLQANIKQIRPSTAFRLPSPELATDNAGMIAIAGFYHYLYGQDFGFKQIKANPNWPLKSWR